MPKITCNGYFGKSVSVYSKYLFVGKPLYQSKDNDASIYHLGDYPFEDEGAIILNSFVTTTVNNLITTTIINNLDTTTSSPQDIVNKSSNNTQDIVNESDNSTKGNSASFAVRYAPSYILIVVISLLWLIY